MTWIAPSHGCAGGRRPARGRLAALVAAGLGALAAAQAARAGDLEQVRMRQKVVVAVFPTQDKTTVSVDLEVLRREHLKVEELRRPEQFRGCYVDLLKGFAASLGVSLELLPVTTGPADLFAALAAGRADLIGGNIGITPKRLAVADFSHPFVSSHIAVVARPGSGIATPADLAGKTAAVIDRSAVYEIVRAELPQAKVKLDQFQTEVYADVEEGAADFTLAATGLPQGAEYRDGSARLTVALVLHDASAAFAARKGSDLVAALDAYLDQMKRSGGLAKVLALCAGPAAPAPESAAAPAKP